MSGGNRHSFIAMTDGSGQFFKPGNPFLVRTMASGAGIEFMMEAIDGKHPKYSYNRQFGRNPEIDADDTEDIWGNGDVYQYLSSGTKLNIVSNSSLDSNNQQGAQTIQIEGLDDDYNEIAESINLSGLVPVITSNLYRRINNCRVTNAGNLRSNQGTITGSGLSGPNFQFAFMPGESETQQTHFTISANKNGYITNLTMNLGRTPGSPGGSSKNAEIRFITSSESGVDITKGYFNLSTDGVNSVSLNNALLEKISEKTDCRFEATPETANTSVSVIYSIILKNI